MTPERREAITVALALVPGLMPRNRLFAFYTHSDARAARRRAGALRSFANQLAGGAEDVKLVPRAEGGFQLAYKVARLHASRRALLSSVEAACVAYLVERSGGPRPAGAPGRELIEDALSHLGGQRTLVELEASG